MCLECVHNGCAVDAGVSVCVVSETGGREARWSARAVSTLATHGVVVVQGLVGREHCDALLRQIEAWPAEAEGTSATTRQPHRRRHQALPMLRNASGVAVSALRQHFPSV